MEFVKNTIAQHPVVVFGKSYCPFCKKALNFLFKVNCTPFNIDLDLYLTSSSIDLSCLEETMELKFKVLYTS